MFTKRNLLVVVLPWTLLLIIGFFWFRQCTGPEKEEENDEKEVVTHNMVIEKIESIGKLELVKYHIKDIVEHTTEMNWWPDPKVVLMVSGDVAGCVDLKSLDSSDVSIGKDQITVILPHPEVCYFKINHDDSKVYNIEDRFLSESSLIDKAYRQAEAQIKSAALKMGLLEETKSNAQKLLKPMLENMTGKKVSIVFK